MRLEIPVTEGIYKHGKELLNWAIMHCINTDLLTFMEAIANKFEESIQHGKELVRWIRLHFLQKI